MMLLGPRRRRFALLAATLLCAGIALGGLALRVRAHADELLLDVGASMLRHPAADQIDATRTLSVNGLQVHLSSGGTSRSLPEVLDLFHARCRERGGRFDLQLAHALRTRAAVERLAPPALDGVLRIDDGARGYVACLDLGGSPVPPDELLRRARRFLEDGDLAHLGDLRFVFAARDGERTSYLALWTVGPFALARAFPAEGDAPGSDLPRVPRPPEARRLLSAHGLGAEPSVTVYRAEHSTPAALGARYRAVLGRAGFRLHGGTEATSGFVAARDDRWLLVTLSADGAHALATLVPF